MSIAIHPELETRIRAGAEARGLTAEAYVERLVRFDQEAEDELQALALEGLASGDPMEAGPGFWEERHRRLDERVSKPVIR
jgi:hypothetical protein